MRLLAWALSWSLLTSQAFAGPADFPFRDLDLTLSAWGIPQSARELPSRLGRPVRIAVLDKTFAGYEKSVGKTLPADVRYFEGPVKIPQVDPSAHGLRMAELASFVSTLQMQHPEWIEMRLYRVSGFTNFKWAIQQVIDWKADIVLHSEVWEVGGNLDGAGFLNQEVSRATEAGVLWVNAAGNYQGLVYQAALTVRENSRALLPESDNRLKVECKAAEKAKCPLRALLVWNAFTTAAGGVSEDLDFDLEDENGKNLAQSHLRQVDTEGEAKNGESKFPRGSLFVQLDPGTYYLTVTAVSKKFSDKTFFRISLDGEFLNLPINTPAETMTNPADNPDVLTVGALDSDRSSRSPRLAKPELWAPSSVMFENGDKKQEFRGSSNAAALTAGVLALRKRVEPALNKARVLLQATRFDWSAKGILSVGGGNRVACFRDQDPARTPAWARGLIGLGGMLVSTREGLKIMLPFDPIRLARHEERLNGTDRVQFSTDGWSVSDRADRPEDQTIEAFQVPMDSSPCRVPAISTGNIYLW